MPFYSEKEYKDRERRWLLEHNELIQSWQKHYEKLYAAASKAIKALNPKAGRCTVWYDKFTGDWSPPDYVQCEEREAWKGKCLQHLADKQKT